jgi:hypothetical protein
VCAEERERVTWERGRFVSRSKDFRYFCHAVHFHSLLFHIVEQVTVF